MGMRARRYYRFNDSINSLSLGTASRLIGAWVKFLGVYPYQWLFRHYHIYHIVVDNWWSTVLIIIGMGCGTDGLC